jgi:fucose permease
MALISTSVAFAVVGNVMNPLKAEFVLTNAEVGWIGGAALWGFSVSMIIFGPLCDKIGFKPILLGAFAAHLIGPLLMITAADFWMLFFGAWIIAFGNGLVEAAGNPLVVALYPDNKTTRLNQFHVWFPGGIVIGGVAGWLLGQAGVTAWEVQIAIILIPTVIYGFLVIRETFPPTENVQAGVSIGEMFRATFSSPFMWLLLFCMALTASTELGPNRWIPAVLQAGGIPGILVLVWISGLMAVLRYNAGTFVDRFSPTGLLLVSAILATGGLLWLSYAETTVMAFLSATLFAFGVCFFWPTMLGVTSERVPRSGALGLGLMGGVGMLVVGVVTSPWMGSVADQRANEVLNPEQTVTILEEVNETFPGLTEQVPDEFQGDITRAMQAAQTAQTQYANAGALPAPETMNALRAISDAGPAVNTTDTEADDELVTEASQLLGPADNYGGRMSFRAIVPFTALLIVIFGVLYWRDRQRGGYKVEKITSTESPH